MSLRRLLPLAFVPLLLLAAACGEDDDGGETTDTSAESDSTGAEDGAGIDLSTLPSYATISELNDDLAAGGISCTLEYEGLVDDEGKEVSLCTIDGQQAQLTVYPDSSTVEALVGADTTIGALAYGQNWTVQVDTAETADAIAAALGGAAVSAEATPTTAAAP